MDTMTSNRPYLIRATYDWIVDNDLTPYVLVNAAYPGVDIPYDYVDAGRIVLNISPKACRGLHLDNDKIVFTTRFAGQPVQIFLVPGAVLAIYAKENGRGMEFEEEPLPPSSSDGAEAVLKGRKKPSLTIVK